MESEESRAEGDETSRSTLDPLVLKLVARRHELGFSQEALSTIAGLSRRTLAAIETGGNCTLSTLRQLARALDVDLLLSSEVDALAQDREQGHRMPTLDEMTEQNRRERFGAPRG